MPRWGSAYDGDADRIGVVDDKGQILWGRELMILFARELLKVRAGRGDRGRRLKCSMRMYDDIRQKGGRAIMWKVRAQPDQGEDEEEKALLAGEMTATSSGPTATTASTTRSTRGAPARDPHPFRQEALRAVRGRPKSFATPELRVETVEEERSSEIVRARCSTSRSRNEVGRRSMACGSVFPDGWGLVRSSNTQPILVLRFGPRPKARLKEIPGAGWRGCWRRSRAKRVS